MKAVLLFALVTLFVTCPAAFARPGDLDSTLGVNGVVQTFLEEPGVSLLLGGCIVQKDNKIVLAGTAYNYKDYKDIGRLILIRYQPDGAIDSSFGMNGKTIIRDTAISLGCSHIAIDQNDKLLISATSKELYRFTSEGHLDSTFNKIGHTSLDSVVSYNSIFQPDGKILIPGFLRRNNDRGFGAIRLYDDGKIDSTFNENGFVLTDYNGNYGIARGAAIDNNKKILLCGEVRNEDTTSDFTVTRYYENGKQDSTFGKDGIVITKLTNPKNTLRDIVVQKDEKILCCGTLWGDSFTTKNRLALLRYNSDGTTDSTFGMDGVVVLHIQDEDYFGNFHIQPDGKIMVSGFSYVMGIGFIYLARFNEDGSTDSLFSENGIIKVRVGDYYNRHGYSAIQGIDKVILCATTSDGTRSGFALLRYRLFDETGVVATPHENIQVKISPNPVSETLLIDYTLYDDEILTLELYDLLGEKITEFYGDDIKLQGKHREVYELKGLSAGNYILSFSGKNFRLGLLLQKQ